MKIGSVYIVFPQISVHTLVIVIFPLLYGVVKPQHIALLKIFAILLVFQKLALISFLRGKMTYQFNLCSIDQIRSS